MKSKIKRILKNLIPIPFVLLALCIAYLAKPFIQHASEAGKKEDDMTMSSAVTPATGYVEEPELEEDPPLQAESADQELPENIIALSYDPLRLCDLYAERGTMAVFKCYYEGAEAYSWEYYDMMARDFTEITDVQSGYDDLGRPVSVVSMAASDENNGTMLRCRISFPDNISITETAWLYVLDKTVTNVFVDDLSADAECFIDIHAIPVTVKYEDGTTEEIIGLSGLHFLTTEVKDVEEGVSVSGNPIETVTTVISEADYQSFGYGVNEVKFRYHPAGLSEKKIDVAATFSGMDQNPPVISQVNFSDYRIGKDLDEVEITVMIMAEDDITPYPLLQYAILPKGQELLEEDWENRNFFVKKFDQNGTWVIYCRDQYGNIGTSEKDLIVNDPEAPQILSVTLEKEGWQAVNTIYVEAVDVLSMTYSFSCMETGEDSGFIARNEYEIANNGTWTIRVRDAAGNMSSEQIYISSIDVQSPVINGITDGISTFYGQTTQKEEH